MRIRDINLDFLSTKKSIVIHDCYAPEEEPCVYQVHEIDQKRSEELISYFFHQVKQSLHAQADNDVPDAEDQLDCVEILSHLFDQLMLELDTHRKSVAQKNTPE